MDLFIAMPSSSLMGNNLERYISQRVHQDILDGSWLQILVAGGIRRSPPAKIFSREKSNTPFNFQRPTATIVDSTTIRLNCFPCKSFVRHYASVISTYLSLTGKSTSIVCAIAPPDSEALNVLLRSNLPRLGAADIVVVGEVYKLSRLAPERWEDPSPSERDLFVWQKFLSPRGKTVALLGCKENIWGETAYFVVRVLQQQSRVKCVLYVGKAGALKPEFAPNEWIATGEESMVDDCLISWKNPFRDRVKDSGTVADGKLVTVSSPLCETLDWLRKWETEYTWVDCESGHMARAANDVAVEFGYLHIVSDNLSGNSPQDLSNEDNGDVDSRREILYREIELIIESFISSWGSTEKRIAVAEDNIGT